MNHSYLVLEKSPHPHPFTGRDEDKKVLSFDLY